MAVRERKHQEWNAGDFVIEARTSNDTFPPEAERYEITLWRGTSMRHGNGLGVTIADWDKAVAIGAYLFEQLADEHAEQERLSEIRWQETKARLEIERTEKKAREKEERAERRKKAKQETVKVEFAVCPECEHADSPDAFEQEVRECSRCGGVYIGEDARRCPECNIFTARVGDLACPSCESPLDGELALSQGVEVDGVFVPDSELET